MAFLKSKRKDKKGRWSDVFRSLGLVLFCYMFLRWLTFEPYVIPSGSMIPTLLIQDYVVVKKWAYGLRIPFTSHWVFGPQTPKRGEIIVFRSKEDNMHFMVKRVVGLPGDKVSIGLNGKIKINDENFKYENSESQKNEIELLQENNGEISYSVQYEKGISSVEHELIIPEGEVFLMGDNRDHSMDSRFWGSLPTHKILGKVTMIWMSCRKSDQNSGMFCPPAAIRRDRIFKWVK